MDLSGDHVSLPTPSIGCGIPTAFLQQIVDSNSRYCVTPGSVDECPWTRDKVSHILISWENKVEKRVLSLSIFEKVSHNIMVRVTHTLLDIVLPTGRYVQKIVPMLDIPDHIPRIFSQTKHVYSGNRPLYGTFCCQSYKRTPMPWGNPFCPDYILDEAFTSYSIHLPGSSRLPPTLQSCPHCSVFKVTPPSLPEPNGLWGLLFSCTFP